MSAGFESCDPYTGNKNIQNFCSTCACIKSNSKPSCFETQVKPQPLRIRRKCFWGGFALSPAGFPASASEVFSTGFVTWENG